MWRESFLLAFIAVGAHILVFSIIPVNRRTPGATSRHASVRASPPAHEDGERLQRMEQLLSSLDLRVEAMDLRLKAFISEQNHAALLRKEQQHHN